LGNSTGPIGRRAAKTTRDGTEQTARTGQEILETELFQEILIQQTGPKGQKAGRFKVIQLDANSKG